MQQLQQTNAIHELDHHSRSREKEKKTDNCFYIKSASAKSRKEKEKKTNQTKNNAAPGKSASWVMYISVSTCVSV